MNASADRRAALLGPLLHGLEKRELKVEVVGELFTGEHGERVHLLLRCVTRGVTQIVRERFFALGIFLDVTEQKFARLGAGDGDGDIGNRPRVLLAQVFLHQTRQRIVGCELVAEGFSKHINEMRVSTVGLCQRVEQRANVIERPPGAERFGGAAANQGIGIV